MKQSAGIIPVVVSLMCILAPTVDASEPIRLSRHVVNDPLMRNGKALSVLLPQNWQANGGIVWDTTMQRYPLCNLWMSLYDPQGADCVTFLPIEAFSYNDMYRQIGTPYGYVQNGMEFQQVMRPDEFINNIVLKRYRTDVPSPRIVGHRELPDVARAIWEAEMKPAQAVMRGQVVAGVCRIHYRQKNLDLEEDIYYALAYMSNHEGQFCMWGPVVGSLYSFRSLRGQLDAKTPLMQSMVASMKPEMQWWCGTRQVHDMWMKTRLTAVRRSGDLMRALAQQNREISDEQCKMWRDWGDSRSQTTEKWCDAIKGIQQYDDPVTGGVTELPMGYDNAWVNARGEYVWSADPTHNPNVGSSIDWKKMERRN